MNYVIRLIAKSRYMLSTTALVFLMSISVSAYTIVMLDGRRVQIPSQFTVGASTLTYAAGPEIQITLQLAAIDIAATERANGEPAGTFLARRMLSGQRQTALSVTRLPARSKAARSITNRDLEKHARVRIESEQAYETRRRELGLPSVEESRARREAEAELLRQELEDARMEQAEDEGYWRRRASEVRSELAAVDAELSVVRTRLAEIPTSLSSSFTVVSDLFPFGVGGSVFGHGVQSRVGPGFDRRGQLHNNRGLRTRVFSAPRGAASVTGGVDYRNITGRRGFPRGGFGGRRESGVWPPQLFPVQNVTSFGSPYNYDLSYEREALVMRLNELVGRRAALRAIWRDLEEEARRAGAMPGWLRP